MSRTRLCTWCCKRQTRSTEGICRFCRPSEAPDREPGPVALTGGQWVMDPRRRVLVWERSVSRLKVAKPDRWSAEEKERRANEEAKFGHAEAKRAHQAYKKGDRSPWATTGHRIYCRRMERLRASERQAS